MTAPTMDTIDASRRATAHGFTVPVRIEARAYAHLRPRLADVLDFAMLACATMREPGEHRTFVHELTRLTVTVTEGPSILITEADPDA